MEFIDLQERCSDYSPTKKDKISACGLHMAQEIVNISDTTTWHSEFTCLYYFSHYSSGMKCAMNTESCFLGYQHPSGARPPLLFQV